MLAFLPAWTTLAPVLLSAGAFSCAWLVAGLVAIGGCSILRRDSLLLDLASEPGQLLVATAAWPFVLYVTVDEARDD